MREILHFHLANFHFRQLCPFSASVYIQHYTFYEPPPALQKVINTKRQTYFNKQLNAQFLYSITICMLHYDPRYISSINMPIFMSLNKKKLARWYNFLIIS